MNHESTPLSCSLASHEEACASDGTTASPIIFLTLRNWSQRETSYRESILSDAQTPEGRNHGHCHCTEIAPSKSSDRQNGMTFSMLCYGERPSHSHRVCMIFKSRLPLSYVSSTQKCLSFNQPAQQSLRKGQKSEIQILDIRGLDHEFHIKFSKYQAKLHGLVTGGEKKKQNGRFMARNGILLSPHAQQTEPQYHGQKQRW